MQARQMYLEAQTVELVDMLTYQSIFIIHEYLYFVF